MRADIHSREMAKRAAIRERAFTARYRRRHSVHTADTIAAYVLTFGCGCGLTALLMWLAR